MMFFMSKVSPEALKDQATEEDNHTPEKLLNSFFPGKKKTN